VAQARDRHEREPLAQLSVSRDDPLNGLDLGRSSVIDNAICRESISIARRSCSLSIPEVPDRNMERGCRISILTATRAVSPKQDTCRLGESPLIPEGGVERQRKNKNDVQSRFTNLSGA
jgi:hypothetical protein